MEVYAWPVLYVYLFYLHGTLLNPLIPERSLGDDTTLRPEGSFLFCSFESDVGFAGRNHHLRALVDNEHPPPFVPDRLTPVIPRPIPLHLRGDLSVLGRNPYPIRLFASNAILSAFAGLRFKGPPTDSVLGLYWGRRGREHLALACEIQLPEPAWVQQASLAGSRQLVDSFYFPS